jgi:hypothetical protein
MFYETCSGKRHFFNGALSQVNHMQNPTIFKPWNKKCDCGKETLSVKELKRFVRQFTKK